MLCPWALCLGVFCFVCVRPWDPHRKEALARDPPDKPKKTWQFVMEAPGVLVGTLLRGQCQGIARAKRAHTSRHVI